MTRDASKAEHPDGRINMCVCAMWSRGTKTFSQHYHNFFFLFGNSISSEQIPYLLEHTVVFVIVIINFLICWHGTNIHTLHSISRGIWARVSVLMTIYNGKQRTNLPSPLHVLHVFVPIWLTTNFYSRPFCALILDRLTTRQVSSFYWASLDWSCCSCWLAEWIRAERSWLDERRNGTKWAYVRWSYSKWRMKSRPSQMMMMSERMAREKIHMFVRNNNKWNVLETKQRLVCQFRWALLSATIR